MAYAVRRRVGAGPSLFVGTTDVRRFEDATLPAGVTRVSYTAYAQRDSLLSETSAAVEVRFGAKAGGAANREARSVAPARGGEIVHFAA